MKNTGLALLGLIFLSTPLATTAQQFGDFTYTSDASAITITGYTGPGGTVTIPASINGLPVATIGDSAFFDQTSVTNLTIPASVTSIGDFAFESCTSLIRITIPNGVTSISYGAFADCYNLASVLIPSSVSNIESQAFLDCISLTNVTIPGNVTSIGEEAFDSCTRLTSVTIPDSVTNIGDSAFEFCVSLTHVTISGKITHFGSLAFKDCYSLTAVTISGATVIGAFAFFQCTSLTDVTISGSVTNVGDGAFQLCTSLTRVFFKGNAPSFYLDPLNYAPLFYRATNAIIYYVPGTMGWGPTFGGRPAVLWNPLMQSSGVGPTGFGFNITGTPDIPFVVEAATNLASANWVALQSLNLTNGAFYFSDHNWTNYPTRFYRIRSP